MPSSPFTIKVLNVGFIKMILWVLGYWINIGILFSINNNSLISALNWAKSGGKMDRIAVYTSITYGVLAILIGIVSFNLTGEVVTFIASAVSGLLILVALVVGSKVNPDTGYAFIGAISLVFGAYTGMMFTKDNTFVPNGIMTVLSATTFAVVGINWLQSRKKNRN